MNLYQRLGGQIGLETAVFVFFKKLSKDNQSRFIIHQKDISKQRQLNVDKLSNYFGGPKPTHPITELPAQQDQQLNGLLMGHFADALKDLGADPKDIEEAKALLLTKKIDLLH